MSKYDTQLCKLSRGFMSFILNLVVLELRKQHPDNISSNLSYSSIIFTKNPAFMKNKYGIHCLVSSVDKHKYCIYLWCSPFITNSKFTWKLQLLKCWLSHSLSLILRCWWMLSVPQRKNFRKSNSGKSIHKSSQNVKFSSLCRNT